MIKYDKEHKNANLGNLGKKISDSFSKAKSKISYNSDRIRMFGFQVLIVGCVVTLVGVMGYVLCDELSKLSNKDQIATVIEYQGNLATLYDINYYTNNTSGDVKIRTLDNKYHLLKTNNTFIIESEGSHEDAYEIAQNLTGEYGQIKTYNEEETTLALK